jgi:diguanylate cyclase (GGDEF)-like protein
VELKQQVHLSPDFNTLELLGLSHEALSDAEAGVPRTNRTNDNATGRRLTLLIGLVVVLACGAAAAVVVFSPAQPRPGVLTLLIFAAAVMAGNRIIVELRVRANRQGTSWSDVVALIGLTLIPAPWVVLCVAVGVALGKATNPGASLQKFVFGVAKDTLNAATAAGVIAAFGLVANLHDPVFDPVALICAYVAVTVVDELSFLPVMALVAHSRISRLAAVNWDVKLVGHLIRIFLVLLVVAIRAYSDDPLLLVVVPLLMVCVHLWHSRRVGTREERSSWQRLAKTTDELNEVDLGKVLHSGAMRAAQIFSADEAEIDLIGDGSDRMVRGTAEQILFDGARTGAAEPQDRDVVTELVAHDGSLRVGVLRLRFGGTVKLTEFEQYKFETFASALCTAIRNASAYDKLERVSAENAHAATHDPLTGLANRRKLYEHADDVFATRADDGILGLLLIDLNHFKEVNDTLGHAAGDQVLCEVANRLEQTAAPGDLVARLGGDEFAVLFTRLATPAMAAHRAALILTALDRTIEVDGMQLTVEAAGGIALAPGTGGVQELMRRADVAMYQAKRSGVRTASYLHARDTADLGRLMLSTDLRRAVDQQEFVVDFQPIVDLGSGEVISAEALARWHHPEQGDLTPVQFLETVERSGQLPAFADAVLEQSLGAIGSWREAGFDLPVAVNVSPRSLLDPDFPAGVLARLERHGVPADRLVLELAETLTISQLEVVARSLGELRDAGVRLALDDFGTGVSSLSVLSRIPVHQLKIDRDFVLAVETSSEAAAVIRSTVDLARSLHLTVVAEGVESEPQRHALWELGCVAGQGHLFARPMRAGRMLAALQRGSGGRPGVLATALHDAGSVVRMPRRRSTGRGRSSLPHLPA